MVEALIHPFYISLLWPLSKKKILGSTLRELKKAKKKNIVSHTLTDMIDLPKVL